MISLDRGKLLLGLLLSLRLLIPVWTLNLTMQNLSLSSSSTLMVGDTLVSVPLGTFELGIFQFGVKYQLGIRYRVDSSGAPIEQVVTWVANRDIPLSKNAYLHVSFPTGILQLFDPATDLDPNIPSWSTDVDAGAVVHTAELRDGGNLVLVDSNQTIIWDSFKNSPITDTLLPGQFFNKTGNRTPLTSWLTKDDPATGHYTFDWSNGGNKPESLQLAWTSPKKFMTWEGGVYFPAPDEPFTDSKRDATSVYWKDNVLMTSGPNGADLIFGKVAGGDDSSPKTLKRLTIDVDGGLRIWQWQANQTSTTWTPVLNWVVQVRGSQCYTIGTCGQFGNCTSIAGDLGLVQCTCPEEFKPLYENDIARGCTPIPPLIDCNATNSTQVKLIQMNGTDMPWAGDYHNFTGNSSSSICIQKCLEDCNCAGAVYGPNKTDNEDLYYCWMKKGPLFNMGYPSEDLHKLRRTGFIKVPPVLLLPVQPRAPPEQHKKTNLGLTIGLSVLGGVLVIGVVVFCAYRSWDALPRICGGVWTKGVHPGNHTGIPDFRGPPNAPPEPIPSE